MIELETKYEPEPKEEMLDNQCWSSTVTGCESINELIEAIKYYHKITINDEKDKEALVMKYCSERSSLLDHYIHFVTLHQNQNDLQCIFDKLIKTNNGDISAHCDGNKCSFLSRHYRQNLSDINGHDVNNDDGEFTFYTDLLDGIHCFVYHLHDRSRRKQESIIYDNKHTDYDHLQQNAKFIIDINDNDDDKGTTFTDHLLKYLQKTFEKTKHLKHWLQQNEFDSDAIELDVVDEKDSNISIHLENKSIFGETKNYLYDVHLYQNSFNIGHRFYYWAYYKNRVISNDNDEIEEWHWNKNDHDGYEPHQLYVQQKYATLKDEVLNNKTFSLNLYAFNVAITKTTKYMATEQVKAWIVRQLFGQNDPLKYNIKNGTPITFDHILAIILYCNETDLSREFSKTFRKTSPYQTIKEVLKKNSEYSVWSRLLREAVEYYGYTGFGDVVGDVGILCHLVTKIQTVNALRGPFYCGISIKMAIPEFSMRLAGPTSTSRQMEVAQRFAGEKGLVMELNNNGTEISGDLRGLLCGWISNYPLEDEVLFIGGEYRIKINTVITIESVENYSEFFKSLYLFDCMMNGSHLNGYYVNEIGKKQKMMLFNLIQRKLSRNNFKNDAPKYINETFESYTNNKKEIIINLHEIDMNLFNIADLVLYGLEKTKIFNPTKKCGEQKMYHDITGTKTNLFKPMLFDLFKNIKRIILYCSQIEFVEYELDMFQLLTVLNCSSTFESNHISIEVKGFHPSWISNKFQVGKCGKLPSPISESIISKFEENNLNIVFQIKKDIECNPIDSLQIQKMKKN